MTTLGIFEDLDCTLRLLREGAQARKDGRSIKSPGFVKSYVDLEIAIVADVNIRSEGELREHYLFLHRVPSWALNSKLTSDAPPLIVAVQMLETLGR